MGKRKPKWNNENLKQEALKFNNRYDFYTKSSGAYHLAAKYKILDKICSHMKLEDDPRYIKSLQVSKGCSSLMELKDRYYPGYEFIIKNKLINQIFPNYQAPKKWTDSELKREALKYKKLSEFRKFNRKAYESAYNRGILSKITSHMIKKPRHYWTFEKILKIAKRYNSREKFQQENKSAYFHAWQHGYIQKILAHMPRRRRGRWKHSYKDALEKMFKCESLSEYKFKYKLEYNFLVSSKNIFKAKSERCFPKPEVGSSTGEKTFINYINKFLGINLKKVHQLDWMKSPKGRKLGFDGYDEKNKIAFEYHGYWHQTEKTKIIDQIKIKECKKRNIKLIILKEKHKTPFIKQYPEIQKELEKIVKKLHLPVRNKKIKIKIIFNGEKYSLEEIQQDIKKCKTYTEFKAKYKKKFLYLSRRNQLNLLDHLERTAHKVKYTKELTWEVAQKCSTYSEFMIKYPTAYANAKKYGIREKIKSLFPELRKPAGYWTDELIIKNIKKHKTSKNLLKKEPGAYFAMIKSKKRSKFLKLFK